MNYVVITVLYPILPVFFQCVYNEGLIEYWNIDVKVGFSFGFPGNTYTHDRCRLGDMNTECVYKYK